MTYSYSTRGWNGARQAQERRKADEVRDREAVRERRDRHRKALRDQLLEQRRAAVAARAQLPLIVPDPVAPVVREVLDALRAEQAEGDPARARAARERRDRDRAPLTAPELRRPFAEGN